MLRVALESSMSSEAGPLTIDDVVRERILSPNKVRAGNADAGVMCEPEERDSSLANSSNTELVVRDFRGIGRGRGLGLVPELSATGGSNGEDLNSSAS